MTRLPVALILFAGSGVGMSLLLALGERDWFLCFTHQTGIWNWAEIRHVALEALSYPLSSATLGLQILGPAGAFCLAYLATYNRPSRACVLLGLCVFITVTLQCLTPLSTQHHCDQIGPFGAERLLFLSIFGATTSVVSLLLPKRLALWKTRVSPHK